jgi:aryl-alcohol dehydrogenase-like predicted oxidoreductase
VGATRPDQVTDNAAASGVELDAETLRMIDDALEGSVAYEGAAS